MHSNNKDVMRFTDINNPEKLWFSRKDNNLIIQELGTQDNVTVTDWFAGSDYRIEDIRLSDERKLDLNKLDKLIEAMASFGAKYSSDISLAPQTEVKT